MALVREALFFEAQAYAAGCAGAPGVVEYEHEILSEEFRVWQVFPPTIRRPALS